MNLPAEAKRSIPQGTDPMLSYEQIYTSYKAFCVDKGIDPLSFEDWMNARDGNFRKTSRFSDIVKIAEEVSAKYDK